MQTQTQKEEKEEKGKKEKKETTTFFPHPYPSRPLSQDVQAILLKESDAVFDSLPAFKTKEELYDHIAKHGDPKLFKLLDQYLADVKAYYAKMGHGWRPDHLYNMELEGDFGKVMLRDTTRIVMFDQQVMPIVIAHAKKPKAGTSGTSGTSGASGTAKTAKTPKTPDLPPSMSVPHMRLWTLEIVQVQSYFPGHGWFHHLFQKLLEIAVQDALYIECIHSHPLWKLLQKPGYAAFPPNPKEINLLRFFKKDLSLHLCLICV